MTIDERLDRLTERHEALAQSAELLLHSSEKHDKALDRLELALDKQGIRMAQIMESIDSLARIALAHENRISRLEDRPH